MINKPPIYHLSSLASFLTGVFILFTIEYFISGIEVKYKVS